ncbi:MAG: UDP-N-acetylmuramate dehydrogenase [Trueperaceae bacterium]|nr:UDP-N-acetylmuramate dehydrogenase [Trueperaceae bacterium]MCW5820666.1 UDP-N-acetylmuramate dehydrogenase [Trueperaceae bacterium]
MRRVRLRDYTTLRVGGEAELWEVESSNDLREATSEPFLVLGSGANLLVADGGVAERVVRLGRAYNSMPDFAAGAETWVGAATPLPGLVRRAQRAGLSGLEGLSGVPAVVGGAVAMNAGTRFGEMSGAVAAVELFVGGGLEVVPAAELGFTYRHTDLPPGAVVTRALLRLAPSTPEAVAASMAAVDAARAGQPKVKSAGCAFKNPAGASAGKLIDEAGLKGLRVGDAMVSFEHGNFIVNAGEATAADVTALLAEVRSRVPVPLELEWRRWGF